MELTKDEIRILVETARDNARKALGKIEEKLDDLDFSDMEVYASRLLTWLHICQYALHNIK